jgi:hypothetical protein
MRHPLAITFSLSLLACPAHAGPIRLIVPGAVGESLLLGVESIDDDPRCRGEAERLARMWGTVRGRIEPDPGVPPEQGVYVLAPGGKSVQAYVLESGCGLLTAPSTAARYKEMVDADRLAQNMNRGRYGPSRPSPAAPVPLAKYTDPEPQETPFGMEKLGSWTGSGSKDTDTFMTTAREWRIYWVMKPTSTVGGLVTVTVKNADTDETVARVSSGTLSETGGDSSVVRTPPGRYYLSINSANATWLVSAVK